MVNLQERTHQASGVGVLDKASQLLAVVERHPSSLAELVARTGLARPTVHRIALALERLELFTRDQYGRFVLGPRLGSLAMEAQRDRLARAAQPVLAELSDLTGLDARLYKRRGAVQICVASAERRTHVPIGSAWPAKAGPIAQVLLAWEEPDELYKGLGGARFSATQLALVRKQGWVYGQDAVAPDTVSVAAPVWLASGQVVAALAVSGSTAQVTAQQGRMLGTAVIDSAAELSDALRQAGRRGLRV